MSPESRASELAKARGVPVTVAESVTESQSVVANPDGSFTAEIHGGPTRFRNAKGDWVDVDLNLYRRPDGSIAPKAHPRGLVLAGKGTGSRDLARFVSKGHEIAVGWEGALPEPSLSGTKATYAEAMPGVDLVVESTRLGFEYFLVVKNRGAASRVAQVRMPWRAEGLTAEHTGEGAVKLRDKSNAVVAWAPAAQMWDARVSAASGDPVAQAKVAVTVEKPSARRSAVGGATSGQSMRVVPDAAFLNDPKTVYPVTIDPAVTEKSEFDTFTQNSYTSDQSAATQLKLGYVVEAGKGYYARSHLSYHGMATYRGAKVISATLYLWNFHSFSCRANTWQAWRTDYVGSTVRWTNPPTRRNLNSESSLTKGYSSSCGEGWVTQNVAETFQTTFNDTSSTTANIEIAAKSTASQDSWKKFDSMEAANDPYVSLNYNRPPAAPTSLTIGGKTCATGSSRPTIASTVTPIQLTAAVSDPDSVNEAVSLNARFFVAELGTALPATPTVTSPAVTQPKSGGAQTATASLPSGFTLQEFHTYYFQVKGWDQEHEGAWSAICEFYVDNGSPAVAPVVTALDTVPGTSTKVYPENGTGGGPGVSSTFRFAANGETDISKYRYKYSYRGTTTNWVEVTTPTPGASVDVELAPPFDNGDGSGTLASINMGGQWAITVEMADAIGRWSARNKLYLTNVTSAPAAVAHWKMNEASGASALVDQTGGFPLETSAVMTKQAQGYGDFGSAWTFDGSSSGYAKYTGAVIDTTRSFAVSAWVRIANLNLGGTSNKTVLDQRGSNRGAFYLQHHVTSGANDWAFQIPDHDGTTAATYKSVYSTTIPKAGVWTHLVGMYDAATRTSSLYVNGTLEGTKTGVIPFAATRYLALGANWSGDLDEVAIWQRTLDPREIGALAAAEVASWDLDMALTDTVGKPVGTTPYDLQGYVDDDAQGIGYPPADDPLWWGSGHPVTADNEDPGAAHLNWDTSAPLTLSLGTGGRPVLRTDQSYSVSVWAKVATPGADKAVLTQMGDPGYAPPFAVIYDWPSGKWAVSITSAQSDTPTWLPVYSLSTATMDTWTHLVAVYDANATRLRFYVNGVLQGERSDIVTWNGTGGMFLGSRGGVSYLFDGSIDEARVFQGVLTADMVGRLYRTAGGPL
ncbi:hypothetical protein CS0771_61960 [Catellatospora sp. IY07-71]|nr:hypothetical protein CS0771_61960 [Catellatospora sp. IY07-71]